MWSYTKRITSTRREIVYLTSVKLDNKAKEFLEIIKKNPFQSPSPYKKLVGNLSGVYSKT